MRRGITLLDLLLALTLLALVLTLGLVRVGPVRDAAHVRATTARLLGAIEAARGTGIRLGAGSALHLDSLRWEVRIASPPDTVVGWAGPGHHHDGVTVTGVGAPIHFGAAGIAVGVANRTLTLTRGTISRTIVLSRLGRVR